MKYRKKPVVIEAFHYTGDGLAVLDWASAYNEPSKHKTSLIIILGEGRMHVPEGNMIIRGVEGELYSCDPEIFKKTYDAII